MTLEYILASSVPSKPIIDFHLEFKHDNEPNEILLLVKKSIEENLLEKDILFTGVAITGTCRNETIEYHVDEVSKGTIAHEKLHRLWYQVNPVVINTCNFSLNESFTHAFQEYTDEEFPLLKYHRYAFSVEAPEVFLEGQKAKSWQIERLVKLSRIDFSQENKVAFLYALNKLQHYALAKDIREQYGEKQAISLFKEAVHHMTKKSDQKALDFLLKQAPQNRRHLKKTIAVNSKKLYHEKNEFVRIIEGNTSITIHSTSDRANLAVAQAIHKYYYQLNTNSFDKYFVKKKFIDTMRRAIEYMKPEDLQTSNSMSPIHLL